MHGEFLLSETGFSASTSGLLRLDPWSNERYRFCLPSRVFKRGNRKELHRAVSASSYVHYQVANPPGLSSKRKVRNSPFRIGPTTGDPIKAFNSYSIFLPSGRLHDSGPALVFLPAKAVIFQPRTAAGHLDVLRRSSYSLECPAGSFLSDGTWYVLRIDHHAVRFPPLLQSSWLETSRSMVWRRSNGRTSGRSSPISIDSD